LACQKEQDNYPPQPEPNIRDTLIDGPVDFGRDLKATTIEKAPSR
jgi:hypothetical protein